MHIHYIFTDAASGSLMLSSNVNIFKIRDADCVEDAQVLYDCIVYGGWERTAVTMNCGM